MLIILADVIVFLESFHGCAYDGGHIVVPVIGKATAENHILFLVCKLSVVVSEGLVALVVDGIVWFHPGGEFCGIFL